MSIYAAEQVGDYTKFERADGTFRAWLRNGRLENYEDEPAVRDRQYAEWYENGEFVRAEDNFDPYEAIPPLVEDDEVPPDALPVINLSDALQQFQAVDGDPPLINMNDALHQFQVADIGELKRGLNYAVRYGGGKELNGVRFSIENGDTLVWVETYAGEIVNQISSRGSVPHRIGAPAYITTHDGERRESWYENGKYVKSVRVPCAEEHSNIIKNTFSLLSSVELSADVKEMLESMSNKPATGSTRLLEDQIDEIHAENALLRRRIEELELAPGEPGRLAMKAAIHFGEAARDEQVKN